MKLYDKALVTVDEMGNKLTRDRIRQFCLLNCKEVYPLLPRPRAHHRG